MTSIAILPSTHETVRTGGHGHRLARQDGFPLVQPAEPSLGKRSVNSRAGWSRAVLSVGVSLCAHASVLACLGYLPTVASTYWIAVEPGRASIALRASMASADVQAESALEAALVEICKTRPREPAAASEMEPSANSTLPVTRADRCELRPPRPTEVAFYGQTAPVIVPLLGDRLTRQPAESDGDARIADARSAVPRTDVGHRLAAEVVVGSIASRPSTASRASDGAETDVPAVARNPAPEYPPEALAAGQTGRVILRVELTPDGTVAEVSVYRSSGFALLDEAALRAVRRWRFSPADSSGARKREVAVPIRFIIDDGASSGD